MTEVAIHLDTCFLIRALVPATDADRRLRDWLGEGHRLCMDLIAWTEFLRRRGTLADCMIAAAAAGRDAALATLNRDDFQCFEGLGLKLLG